MDDSTEGKGCSSDMSGGGGVKVFCSGDAVYDWRWEAKNGGKDVRLLIMCGEC